MMGDEALYRRLLRMFRDRESDFATRFRAARAEGREDDALRCAHNLKSVAGSLAAHAVQQAAAALERACGEGTDEGDIERLLRDVERPLEAVVAELQSLG